VSNLLPPEFVQSERKRVFEPESSFARRVVASLDPVTRPGVLWDHVPSFARPIVAVATVFLVALATIQVFYPVPPEMGIVDAYLAAEATPAEAWLYWDEDPPEGQDLLIEIGVADSQWSPE
jgi:hypothetical protein